MLITVFCQFALTKEHFLVFTFGVEEGSVTVRASIFRFAKKQLNDLLKS